MARCRSDFANLTFNLPEGWAIASDEDIPNLEQEDNNEQGEI